jgi:DNA-binding transcriptional regulator YdaS (Cro superfamily)
MSGITLVIKKIGTQKALAEALGVSTMSVSKWVSTGRIPVDRVLTIEKLTLPNASDML